MKKIITILVIAIIMCIAVVFFVENGAENDESDIISTSVNSYDDIEETTETTTEEIYTIPVSEWGFYNLSDFTDEYGRCALVITTGFNLNKGYVILDNFFEKGAYIFENGFVSDCSLSETGEINSVNNSRKYDIVNNDTLYCYDGFDDIKIKKRLGTSVSDDFVAFEIRKNSYSTYWYVPASLIDWSKGVDEIDDNGESKKILYLK